MKIVRNSRIGRRDSPARRDGTMFTVFGGGGIDQLTVDAQAGIPTQLANTITIAPGGAVVNFFAMEDVILLSDTFLGAFAVERTSEGRPLFAPAPSGPLTDDHTPAEGDSMAIRSSAFNAAGRSIEPYNSQVASLSGAMPFSKMAATSRSERFPQDRPQPSAAGLRSEMSHPIYLGHFTSSADVPVGFHHLLRKWEVEHKMTRRPPTLPVENTSHRVTAVERRRIRLRDLALEDGELFASDWPSLSQTDRLDTQLVDAALEGITSRIGAIEFHSSPLTR